jgi:TP901 family phage tail tape measure protein
MMATRTETLKLIISGDGRLLSSELVNADERVKKFERNVGRSFSGLSRSFATFKGMGSHLGNLPLISGIASSAGIMMAGKQIIDYDASLMRLAIQSNITNEELAKLKNQIADTALATGQSKAKILSGYNKIIEQTGDMKFARDVMKDLAIASTASGAGMEYMGALAVQLRDKMRMSKDEIKASLNLLTVQGKAGAFTLENMATMGERLFAAAGRFDMKGIGDLRHFGSLLQIARMGTGSSEQATTAIENLLADMLDKQKELKRVGFDIFGPDKKIKDIDSIIKGIVVATKGNETVLGKIFGRESIRAISTLAKLYRDTGGFALYEQLSNADAGRANEIMADFARYSTSAAYQLQTLYTIAGDFANSALSPTIADLNSNLKNLTSNPEKMQEFRSNLDDIAKSLSVIASVGIGAAKAVGKVYDFVDTSNRRKMLGDYFDRLPIKDKRRLSKEYKIWEQPDTKSQIRAFEAALNSLDSNKSSLDKGLASISPADMRSATVQNNITINMQMTDSGRVAAVTDSSNTKVKVNRGAFD